jgi:glycosyltransferase involved in cell wall biosynthesis
LKNAVYRFTGLDLEKTEKGIRFYFLLPILKGYDHVQLINSDAVETHPAFELWLYKKLLRQNKKMGLLVCGDETPVIEYNLSGKQKYSILTPYLNDPALKPMFRYSLKYTQKKYRRLFGWVAGKASATITSDLDYTLPMQAMGYTVNHIANPVNVDAIAYLPMEIKGKVVIFLGINRLSYIKKGIPYFEGALQIIQRKYPDTVEVIITENVPYAEYIKSYNSAHILLDQVYGYDQGYNALEAMAKGKVVFTGAETEFMQHYNLTENVAVNAIPDAEAIAAALSALIENPSEIQAISRRARAFIEKEHHYIDVAGKYITIWEQQYK